jgi:formylglycine-generating enzyme required for sulfatase activity
VEITYDLAADSIVTLDVCTNGNVSIGGEHIVTLVGDVNREVKKGHDRRILWFADRDWAGPNFKAGDLNIIVKAWSKSVPPDYLVVDLRLTNTDTCSTRMYYANVQSIPGGVTNDIYKTKKLLMRRIPAANVAWRMGSPVGETGRATADAEHYVSFAEDYYIGVYPITMGQYRQICGVTPVKAMSGIDMSIVTNADAHPAGGISYAYNKNDPSGAWLRKDIWPQNKVWSLDNFNSDGAIAKVSRLSGIPFDLPTEAQWEYACRAGTGTAYSSGKECTAGGETLPCPNMDEVGWYNQNTKTTQPVGHKRPNDWGIYDMHGNVWEWCIDWYGTFVETVSSDPVKDPYGAETNTGKKRVRRGGGYSSGAKFCRSGGRGSGADTGNYVNHGFRLYCPVPEKW